MKEVLTLSAYVFILLGKPLFHTKKETNKSRPEKNQSKNFGKAHFINPFLMLRSLRTTLIDRLIVGCFYNNPSFISALHFCRNLLHNDGGTKNDNQNPSHFILLFLHAYNITHKDRKSHANFA